MTDDTVRQAPDLVALERALAAARAEADGLARELGAICAESDSGARRISAGWSRAIRRSQQDSAATQSRIAAIRASNTWRALEALRRVRTRLGLQRGPDGGFSGVARPRPRQEGVPRFVKIAPLGVNVAGYLDTESGMGEAARAQHPIARSGRPAGRAEQRRVAPPQAGPVLRRRVRPTPIRIRSTSCT